MKTDTIETVYWLGAGASRDCGGPLLKDFFSGEGETNKMIEDDYSEHYKNYFRLKKLYQKLMLVESDIESFFNFIVNSRFIGVEFRIEGRPYKPNTIINMLEYYICKFVFDRIGYTDSIPDYYRIFVGHCVKSNSSVITFNYDCIFDCLIFSNSRELNYGFLRDMNISVRIGIKSIYSGIYLLKLHGSLNWMICKKCNRINIFNTINIFQRENKCRRYNCDGMLKPIIVPPIWNKNEFAKFLKPLWKEAIDLLENVRKLIIVGYSFPKLDLYAWDLLRIAKILNPSLKIEIVNGKDFNYTSFQKNIAIDIVPSVMSTL